MGASGAHLQSGKILPWAIAALLVVAIGSALWVWKSKIPDGTAATAAHSPGAAGRKFVGGNRPQPVSVATVRRQDIRVTVNAIGTITASNTALVRAQVGGVLQSLAFSEGEQVKVGQLLARIDARAFEASLAQAEGTLARDRAQLENARLDLLRYRDLLAKDAIARQQLDTQEALVRQLEGTLKADRAAVETARLQLSYTRVTAPIAGRVGLKQADLGNVVQPNDAGGIVTITQTRPIALMFALPAQHLPTLSARLHAKQSLLVEAWDRAGSTRLAAGEVTTVDNAIDTGTDTIKVKALFPNDDDGLYPNQSVSVRLQLDTLAAVLAVPQAAVLRGAQGFYVYVVATDKSVSTRLVKPGTADDGWISIEGSLQPGDQVVIDGVDRLREGATVEVVTPDAKDAVDPAEVPAASGERSKWMDRLPPEVAEKVSKMSPEERRTWLQKRREAGKADESTR